MRNGQELVKDAQASYQGPAATTSGDGTGSTTAAARADSPPRAVDANIAATDNGTLNGGEQGELPSPISSQQTVGPGAYSVTPTPGAYRCYPGNEVQPCGYTDDHDDEFSENVTINTTPAVDIEVEAFKVSDSDEQEETIDRLHQELGLARQELGEARQAQLSAPVVEGVPLPEEHKGENKGMRVAIVAFFLLFTIAGVVGLSVYFTQQSNDGQDYPPQVKEVLPPVMSTVKERGVLRCKI